MKKNQKNTSLEAIFSLPLNKSALVQIAHQIVTSLKTDQQRVEAVVAISAVEKLLEYVRIQIVPKVEEFVNNQMEHKQNRTEAGIRYSGRYFTKWDFGQDVKYLQLQQEKEVLNGKIKAREDFLKQLAAPTTHGALKSYPAKIVENKFALYVYLPE